MMSSDLYIKEGIARMYLAMARVCDKHHDLIKNDMSNFQISDLKQGYEFETCDGVKYQLILELKKVRTDEV